MFRLGACFLLADPHQFCFHTYGGTRYTPPTPCGSPRDKAQRRRMEVRRLPRERDS